MGQLHNSHSKFVVLGFGVSGKPSYKYLKLNSFNVSVINKGLVSEWCGDAAIEDCFQQDTSEAREKLESADFIILSPGIPRDHKMLNGLRLR